MNKRLFSITGVIFMILGIVVPIVGISQNIYQYSYNSALFSDMPPFMAYISESLIFAVVFLALVFLPGLNFYKISKKEESNKLESWAIWLTISSIVLLILLLLFGLVTGADGEGIAWTMAFFGGFLLIPYGIGVLLLIINLFVKKK